MTTSRVEMFHLKTNGHIIKVGGSKEQLNAVSVEFSSLG
jgi:hypothetical protein